MEKFDNTVKGWLSVVDNNDYATAALSIILVLYAGLAAPQLPEYIANLFDYTIVKLIVFFLLAYGARKNPTVAIIAAVGVMITLHTLNRIKINKQIISNIIATEEATTETMGNVAIEEAGAEEQIPEEALAEIKNEAVAPPNLQGCARRANFRNSFYPQYVNMKPDAYMARYTGNDIAGYDSTAAYSSI